MKNKTANFAFFLLILMLLVAWQISPAYCSPDVLYLKSYDVQDSPTPSAPSVGIRRQMDWNTGGTQESYTFDATDETGYWYTQRYTGTLAAGTYTATLYYTATGSTTLTIRPNAAGTYQEWSTFGDTVHWSLTSDQSDTTGVQVTGSTTLEETENLQDASQTGTINSVTAYMRAKATGSAVVWTEAFSSFTPAGSGWQNYDIFTNKGVPKGAIAEIVIASVNDAADRTVGVRTDGSSLNRYVNLHESEAGGATTVNMLVKVHETTGLIETYCSATTGITFYLFGYWTGVNFTELATTFQTATIDAWHDKNLFTDYGIPKGSVNQIHCHHTTTGAAEDIGVRTDGSSLERRVLVHEAEGTAAGSTEGYTTYVKTSVADGIIELYSGSATTVYFMLLGYFDSTMDYQEKWVQKDCTATGWTDFDLTADLDQDGRVTNFVLTHFIRTAEHSIGARTDGSSLLRYILQHEAETNGYTGFGVTVQSSPTTGIVELYTSTTSEYFWLAGYIFDEEKAVIIWRTYSTNYESGAISISRTAFTDCSETRTTNPNTGQDWTWTEVNALEIGSRASTLGSTETIQVSEYWIVVTYSSGNLTLEVARTSPDGATVTVIGTSTTAEFVNTGIVTSKVIDITTTATPETFNDERLRLRITWSSGSITLYWDSSSTQAQLSTPSGSPPIPEFPSTEFQIAILVINLLIVSYFLRRGKKSTRN